MQHDLFSIPTSEASSEVRAIWKQTREGPNKESYSHLPDRSAINYAPRWFSPEHRHRTPSRSSLKKSDNSVDKGVDNHSSSDLEEILFPNTPLPLSSESRDEEEEADICKNLDNIEETTLMSRMLSSQLSLHSISKEVSPLVEDLERKRSAAHDKKICAQEDQEEAIWDTVEVVDEDERMSSFDSSPRRIKLHPEEALISKIIENCEKLSSPVTREELMRGGLITAIKLVPGVINMEAVRTIEDIHIIRDVWRDGLIDHPEYLGSIYRSREEPTLTRYAALYAVGRYICAAEAHIRAKEGRITDKLRRKIRSMVIQGYPLETKAENDVLILVRRARDLVEVVERRGIIVLCMFRALMLYIDLKDKIRDRAFEIVEALGYTDKYLTVSELICQHGLRTKIDDCLELATSRIAETFKVTPAMRKEAKTTKERKLRKLLKRRSQ